MRYFSSNTSQLAIEVSFAVSRSLAYPVQRSHSRLNFQMKPVLRWLYSQLMALLTVLDFPLETTCSCKQDTKERYWGQQFWQMERHISVVWSLWTTFKAGPEYSGRTKPKWSVPTPFDEPTEISGILG